jgi:hypothetical protein
MAQNAASRTVYYASIGPALTLFDIDVEGTALTKQGTVVLPTQSG